MPIARRSTWPPRFCCRWRLSRCWPTASGACAARAGTNHAMALRGWLTIDDWLRPAMLVTWAVAAERVLPHVPPPLLLDTVPGPDGAPLALLTVAAVLNVNLHSRLTPRLRLTFAQANYRTYVQPHAGGPTGVYFFGNFVSARLPWLPTWLASPNVYYGAARMAGRVPRTRGGA